jgi:hypothetical protein
VQLFSENFTFKGIGNKHFYCFIWKSMKK